jgi:hypothetical protein
MNYERFKAHKERVNQSKRFIKLHIESKSFFLSLKDGGQIAVLRINQDYASDSFRAFRSEGDTKDQFRDFG